MKKLTLRLPGETDYLARLREFTLDYARELGFDETVLGEIEMSVDEAATNVIRHAYGEDPDLPDEKRRIEIELSSDEKQFIVLIRDFGRPYNPVNAPLPDLEKHFEERKTHGLGVFAMRTFMDNMEHHYSERSGNELMMRKNLPTKKN